MAWIDDEIVQQIVDLKNEGFPDTRIAKQLGLCRQTVAKTLKARKLGRLETKVAENTLHHAVKRAVNSRQIKHIADAQAESMKNNIIRGNELRKKLFDTIERGIMGLPLEHDRFDERGKKINNKDDDDLKITIRYKLGDRAFKHLSEAETKEQIMAILMDERLAEEGGLFMEKSIDTSAKRFREAQRNKNQLKCIEIACKMLELSHNTSDENKNKLRNAIEIVKNNQEIVELKKEGDIDD